MIEEFKNIQNINISLIFSPKINLVVIHRVIEYLKLIFDIKRFFVFCHFHLYFLEMNGNLIYSGCWDRTLRGRP